jgi:hypothetical protein
MPMIHPERFFSVLLSFSISAIGIKFRVLTVGLRLEGMSLVQSS